jgi:hypothetical protein
MVQTPVKLSRILIMALYDYACVFTIEWGLYLQSAALKAGGGNVARAEKIGDSRQNGLTELQGLLNFPAAGDALGPRGLSLMRATEQRVDTSTASGNAYLDMLNKSSNFRSTCGANVNARAWPRRETSESVAGRRSVRLLCNGCVTNRRGPAAVARRLGLGRTSSIARSAKFQDSQHADQA